MVKLRLKLFRLWFWRWTAFHLPRPVIYWAAIRLGAEVTTGKWGDTVVPELRFMQALERWGIERL